METTFKITGDYIELTKLLKITGLCDTGGMAQTVTADGQVSVDGAVELRKRYKIRPGQIVTFAGDTVTVG
ncbi:MAG: RNA-binding S4 domain-containing protein [Pseudomonadota bacterium]